MKRRKLYVVLIICMILTPGIIFAKGNLTAQVTSTKLVSKVRGMNGSSISWKKSKSYKGMIVTLKANIPDDMTLWSTDFNISYQNGDGDDDRSRCRGIQTAVSSIDDNGLWIIDNYARIKVKKGTRYFKLLFPIANTSKTFSLQYSKPLVKDVEVKRD